MEKRQSKRELCHEGSLNNEIMKEALVSHQGYH